MTDSGSHFLILLEQLPSAYTGSKKAEAGPYGLVGVGEGTLAAALAQTLVANSLTRTGTQFVLSSPDVRGPATDYADLAEVAGATVKRVSTGGTPEEIDVLVHGGPLATYHFAQYVAYSSGHAKEAERADTLIAELAAKCAPHIELNNPARDLAWSLWGRLPLLISTPEADALPQAWQQLLARTAKTLSVPLVGDILPLVTGAFEAQHEKGDTKVALILGDTDEQLMIAREVLDSRIDEVIHVPYPDGETDSYAGQLALWYFGVWVAAYLAQRYSIEAADNKVLARAQTLLSGEDKNAERFSMPRDDLRRTNLLKDWQDEQDLYDADQYLTDDEDEDLDEEF